MLRRFPPNLTGCFWLTAIPCNMAATSDSACVLFAFLAIALSIAFDLHP